MRKVVLPTQPSVPGKGRLGTGPRGHREVPGMKEGVRGGQRKGRQRRHSFMTVKSGLSHCSGLLNSGHLQAATD